MNPTHPSSPERAPGISDAEWKTRVDLAACYRLIALFGMSDLIYNHITTHIPGTDDELLINPYGLMYEEITASSLVRTSKAMCGTTPTRNWASTRPAM